jgi:hypothetical protein
MRSANGKVAAAVVVGVTVLLATAISSVAVSPERTGADARPLVPEITVELNDTTVSPFDSIYYLSVFLTIVTQEVAGMQIDISASRPDLVSLADSEFVDTIILCIDTVDCDPADTVISTGVDLRGSAIAGWEFLDGSSFSPTYLRFVGLADNVGGGSPPPLSPSETRRFLFRVVLKREMPIDILDTMCDRTVNFFVSPASTHFSDPNGNLIGDETTNMYVNGSLTIGPTCLVGDANVSASINSADIIFLVNFIFKGGTAPGCSDARSGDVECSGSITSSDVIYLVNFVFKSGPAPCCG